MDVEMSKKRKGNTLCDHVVWARTKNERIQAKRKKQQKVIQTKHTKKSLTFRM